MINAVHMAVDRIMRQDRGRLVAILAASLNDFSLAEDALQDALSIALDKWAKTGVPQKPTAWLYQVAKRRAVDVIRRRRNFKTKTPDIQILHQEREEIPEFGIQDHLWVVC